MFHWLKKNHNSLLFKIGIKSDRTTNIVRHVAESIVYKGGSILSNFMLVPITIKYLGTENYGIWLTINAFILWFSFFDVGLGQGLRNKFAEANARGNLKLAQAYVSSVYFTTAAISLVLLISFLFINGFVNWSSVFNSDVSLKADLSILMPIVIGFFCLQLIVKLITSVYLGGQNHSIQIKIQFYTQILLLLSLWVLFESNKDSSLLIFGTIFSVIPFLILLILNFIGFSNRYKEFKPNYKLCKKTHVKELMGLGLDFFIIQIAVIVLFSTDNFIISKLFSPKDVVPYNIALKYFSIVTMLYSMVVAPYWSSFTDAYTKEDFMWIKTSFKSILKIWIFIPFVLLIMIFVADKFYLLWVGEQVLVPKTLSICMAIFIFLQTFNMLFTYFINGVGKIKIQLIISVISIIINIPLSIYFAKNLNLGPQGVILASSVSLLMGTIIKPVQCYKIITKTASGIWNK